MAETSSPGRPRMYASSSEKVQAFRQRQASSGYLRREVLLTEPVSARVVELAKEHQVSIVDVTSALVEQGLSAYESHKKDSNSLGLALGALNAVVGNPQGSVAQVSAATPLLQGHAAGLRSLSQPVGAVPGAGPAQALAATGSNPITDFFNRRKETYREHT